VNHGWTLLRFPEHAIKSNVSACVDKIREVVSQLSKGIP
jgi:very-short-patch-repair endonuclease